MKKLSFLLLFGVLISACMEQSTPPAATQNIPTAESTPTMLSIEATDTPIVTPQITSTSVPTQTLVPTLAPDAWMELPAVPLELSERVHEVFEKGQSLGNNPNAFMKIGDSNSTTTWFLGPLGRGEYSLGEEYAHLQPAIDTFQESFLRNSVSVKRGLNASSVFSPLWADPKQCQSGETPLDCELRIMQPAYALVMLGTNDITRIDQFEAHMRQIIEVLLKAGVIPILSTKVDNIEGNHIINATIANLAVEYQIPLWNLWAALQPLDNHGMQLEDEAHLTWYGCYFDDPYSMQSGFAWRNLTALQVIDKVWRGVQ